MDARASRPGRGSRDRNQHEIAHSASQSLTALFTVGSRRSLPASDCGHPWMLWSIGRNSCHIERRGLQLRIFNNVHVLGVVAVSSHVATPLVLCGAGRTHVVDCAKLCPQNGTRTFYTSLTVSLPAGKETLELDILQQC
jgi:hypothetical protein